MKTILCQLAFSFAFLSLAGGALAQGSLTPSGAPGATMKTLQQIEPRTAISSLPFAITNAGSYYLTTNLTGAVGVTNGISISAGDVTLDLMGFALIGGTGDGIRVSSFLTNIAIFNGTVRGWSGDGVDAFNARNSQFERLRVSSNGGIGISAGISCLVIDSTVNGNGPYGIYLDYGSTARNCSARSNVGDGIHATIGCTISDCIANDNGVDGISASSGCTISSCTMFNNGGDGIDASGSITIRDCTAYANGIDGINVANGCTVSGSTASSNGSNGIVAGGGCTISGCTTASNTGNGIQVANDCRVLDNVCYSNGLGTGSGAGIHATISGNRIEANSVNDNDRGIDVDGTSNLIIRNSAQANPLNYDIVANNKVGVIVSAPFSGAVSGTIGGVGVGTTDPWANFSF